MELEIKPELEESRTMIFYLLGLIKGTDAKCSQRFVSSVKQIFQERRYAAVPGENHAEEGKRSLMNCLDVGRIVVGTLYVLFDRLTLHTWSTF